MFIYVASPYSSPAREVECLRYLQVMKFMTFLINEFSSPRDPTFYSPILHCHDWAEKNNLAKDAVTWRKMNMGMLRHASALFVLRLDGWRESKGLSTEIQFAKDHWIPITYWKVVDEENYFGTQDPSD
jgi:hypothetical protein